MVWQRRTQNIPPMEGCSSVDVERSIPERCSPLAGRHSRFQVDHDHGLFCFAGYLVGARLPFEPAGEAALVKIRGYDEKCRSLLVGVLRGLMRAPLRGEPTPGVHTLLAGVPDAGTQLLPAGLLQLLRIQTVPDLLFQPLPGPYCWKRVRSQARGSIGVIKDEPRRTRLRELNRTFHERPVMLALACISK